MHGWIYEKLGLDAEYKKIKVTADGLERWLGLPSAKKLDGFNVTIPHKAAIIPFLDEINARTAPIGAVNCVHRHQDKLIGYNTDWYGFVKSLEAAGVDLAGRKVVVLGSGGAARAITYGLARIGVAQTTVIARDPERAAVLIKDLQESAEGMQIKGCSWDASAVEPIEDAYCLVNCAPAVKSPDRPTSPSGVAPVNVPSADKNNRVTKGPPATPVPWFTTVTPTLNRWPAIACAGCTTSETTRSGSGGGYGGSRLLDSRPGMAPEQMEPTAEKAGTRFSNSRETQRGRTRSSGVSHPRQRPCNYGERRGHENSRNNR
jgi:hypothetical protein